MIPRTGVIFALHRVMPRTQGDFQPNNMLEVTPQFLEDTIATVRRLGFDTVSLDEATARVAAPAARPFACFTFDDAYRDNAVHALPVMTAHDVPFTIFVPEQFADGTGQLWWVELERAIAGSTSITVPELFAHERIACGTAREKNEAYRRVYWRVRRMDEIQGREIVRNLCRRSGVDVGRLCGELIMSWDELRALRESPLVSFGAHTVSHYALAKLHPNQVRQEMLASKRRLEQELQQPCRHFCYPYGDLGSAGPRDFDLAREAGFVSAVTMQKGLVDARHANGLHNLPRCSLNGNYQDQRFVSALLSGLPFLLWNGLSRRPPAKAGNDNSIGAAGAASGGASS